MGQQLPFSLNGQGAYGQPLPAMQPVSQSQPLPMPGFANSAITPPLQPGATQHTAIPGVDPQMMNAAQQSLANPNGGDMNTVFPGPKALALGAGTGIGVALGMDCLNRNDVFHKIARVLDKVPGSDLLRGKIDPYLQAGSKKSEWIAKHKWLNEFLMPEAHLPPNTPEHLQTEAVQRTMHAMEQNQINGVLGAYQARFQKQPVQLKGAYNETLAALKDKGHNAHNYLEAVGEKQPVHAQANFKTVVTDLEAQIKHLKALPEKTKEQKALQKTLYNVKERISGIDNWYKPLYESQVGLTAKLSAEGVGPVGRSFAGFANYVQRIFNGSTMGMSGKAAEKTAGQAAKKTGIFQQAGKFISENAGKILGPVAMGATIFGFSFQAAHNAKDGEKNKTFFHNLLGSQIFNFIGWEFGRKALNSMQVGTKVFGRIAGKTLPGFLSKIPILGSITLAGFGTEIAAMLIFGSLFQKVGEKISGAIFGKPSQASIDGKGNGPKQQNQQNQANPALSGMVNPVWMGQPGMQQANRPPAQTGWPAQQMPSAPISQPNAQNKAAFPAQGKTLGAPSASRPNAAPATPGSAAQPSRAKFSITPQEISSSKVANDYDDAYKQLKADKTLDKGPSKLLDRM
jgi:hypothetical protein